MLQRIAARLKPASEEPFENSGGQSLMKTENISNKQIKEISQRKKVHPLYRALFLDVLFNKRTRSLFVYAVFMIVIGTALYHWLEGWGWLDALYFVVITLTTIGYGDFTPTQPVTKLITIFYGLNGIILLLMLFDVVRTLRGWDLKQKTSNEQS
jgi:hypothetical protein